MIFWTNADEGRYSFDKGRSLVDKSNDKKSGDSFCGDIGQKKLIFPSTFYRASSITHGLANFFVI